MAQRQWQDVNALTTKGKNDAYYNYQMKYEQMTKQQQLIEQKKQEIQKRLEEKKKKETEEALKKLNEDKLRSAEASRSKRTYYGYSKSKHWTGRERTVESSPATLPTNIFSNDGSFFEQFQKLSGIKVETRKKTYVNPISSSETNNGDIKNKESIETATSGEEKEERRKERRWSSPERSHSPPKLYQPQIIQQNIQQKVIQQQQVIQQHAVIQQQQAIQQQVIHQQTIHQQTIQQQQTIHHQHQVIQQQPPLQQQVFTPQQMPPPPISMNYPPHFNPMQCGMMLPPPMTPSSIPPPAPLNPGSIPSPSPLQPCSIPSPSPLQPCSIPSPSPLQPYAIPPPSPLIPHSIPPPSPMVPHSIPPPSPLTPHSIPPPLPLRPQSIPPPLQRPPMFLSMVPPPPPPPPPEEEKPKVASSGNANSTRPVPAKVDVKAKSNIEDNVKDLFKNDDYSSSSSSASSEDEKDQIHGPYEVDRLQSDSESEPEQKSPGSNSDKESDAESYNKLDSLSELDSELGQESQPVPETESESEVKAPSYVPIVIEDTETQFPSDTKDSSNTGEAAPPDLSSEGDTLPGHQKGSGSSLVTSHSPDYWQEEVKKEPVDIFDDSDVVQNPTEIKEDVDVMGVMNLGEELKQEVDLNVKQEDVKCEVKSEVKQEAIVETFPEGIIFKSEEPPTKKKRKSRWASSCEKVDVPPVIPSVMPPTPTGIRPPGVGPVGMVVPTMLGGVNTIVPPLPPTVPTVNIPGMSGAMISKVGRSDPALVAYAMKAFGHTNLTDTEWKKAEDHYKINLLYQDMMRKKEELQMLQAAGRNKYEYDSDEETDGGTWEHKLRSAEMEATQLWAEELTEQAKGKHHIGDFLPPDELARFMEKYEALKQGREPDLSDYKEFKLKEDNLGFQMLQKLGWTEGQGLGPDGSGIMDPVNKAVMRPENQGLGVERPDDVEADDDEYDAYRKRMMLAYRFRPNPMNNPRRPYY